MNPYRKFEAWLRRLRIKKRQRMLERLNANTFLSKIPLTERDVWGDELDAPIEEPRVINNGLRRIS